MSCANISHTLSSNAELTVQILYSHTRYPHEADPAYIKTCISRYFLWYHRLCALNHSSSRAQAPLPCPRAQPVWLICRIRRDSHELSYLIYRNSPASPATVMIRQSSNSFTEIYYKYNFIICFHWTHLVRYYPHWRNNWCIISITFLAQGASPQNAWSLVEIRPSMAFAGLRLSLV